MKTEDAEIAVAAIDATTRPERWNDLCDVIAKHLGARSFVLQEYNIAEHAAPTFHASKSMRTGDGRRVMEEVIGGYETTAAEKRGYQALTKAASGTVLGEAEAFGFSSAGPPSFNPIRDRVLLATGGTTRSALRLNQLGPWMDVAISCDVQDDYSASRQLVRYAPALSAILTKALESKRLLARSATSYSVLLDIFDRLSFGLAFCDEAGTILVANKKLRQLLSDKDAITNTNKRIEAASDADKRILREAIATSSGLHANPEGMTLSLTRRSGGGPVVIHIANVEDATIAKSRVSLVFVLDPYEERHLEADGLAVLGNLTDAETEICNLILKGLGTSLISDHRGTGIETVRGQIKSIMQKLQCNQRSELVRLAMVTSPKLFLDGQK